MNAIAKMYPKLSAVEISAILMKGRHHYVIWDNRAAAIAVVHGDLSVDRKYLTQAGVKDIKGLGLPDSRSEFYTDLVL